MKAEAQKRLEPSNPIHGTHRHIAQCSVALFELSRLHGHIRTDRRTTICKSKIDMLAIIALNNIHRSSFIVQCSMLNALCLYDSKQVITFKIVFDVKISAKFLDAS